MKKKLLIALPVCVLTIVILCLVLFTEGKGDISLAQRIRADGFLSEKILYNEETGEPVRKVYVVAANDSEAAEKDSFLWFRNRYDSIASHIELNIAFGSDGTACLADSFDSVNENSVKLERVLGFVHEKNDLYKGFLFNLCEYSDVATFASTLEALELEKRSFIKGIDENSLSVISRYFRNIPVLCSYSSDTVSSIEQLKENGANGIICYYTDASPSLIRLAKESGLSVWVECEADIYVTVKAIYYGADGIISTNPDMVSHCIQDWGTDENLLETLIENY